MLKESLLLCSILILASAVKLDTEHYLSLDSSHYFKVIRSITSPCPKGKTAYSNSLRPTSNGCGSSSTQVKIGSYLAPYLKTLTPCCDAHDICFGTCGAPDFKASFKKCNDDFKNCMYQKCEDKADKEKWYKKKAALYLCKTNAFSFYELVVIGGKTPYENAQKKHCSCR